MSLPLGALKAAEPLVTCYAPAGHQCLVYQLALDAVVYHILGDLARPMQVVNKPCSLPVDLRDLPERLGSALSCRGGQDSLLHSLFKAAKLCVQFIAEVSRRLSATRTLLGHFI
jgi:hypothetical protein